MEHSSATYTVRVSKDSMIFSCGHFITFNGNDCERLHGHNYSTSAEVVGPLDENFYVFDFIALKLEMQTLVAEWDHHMLLAMHNPLLPVVANGANYEVRFGSKLWSFPMEDCILLPIENTTTERLAWYLANRLLTLLQTKYHFTPKIVRMEVHENVGQVALCELRPNASSG